MQNLTYTNACKRFTFAANFLGRYKKLSILSLLAKVSFACRSFWHFILVRIAEIASLSIEYSSYITRKLLKVLTPDRAVQSDLNFRTDSFLSAPKMSNTNVRGSTYEEESKIAVNL